MQSVMNHSFSNVPNVEIPRSSFDRSFGHKTTFDAGYLVPIMLDEALPGDTFTLDLNAFARLATPINPIMDNMFMDFHYWAVPVRLVWDNFVKMMGEQTDPGDSIDYTCPLLLIYSNPPAESLNDYFGLPTTAISAPHSLFHRAYNLIYNEWYRDENLQDSVPVPTGDGPDDDTDFVLLRRGKRKDYFTSALPWPQKGDQVLLPLGSQAPLVGIGVTDLATPTTGTIDVRTTQGTVEFDRYYQGSETNLAVFDAKATGPTLDLYADLTNATAASINELRQAFQVQRMLERDARGGTRYTELIRSHFGVTSPDARLQRPEYLGGGTVPVTISPIAQTSQTDPAGTPQANLAAIGTASASGVGFSKSFTEHTLIIGLVSVRADLTYQQGLPRMFQRSSRYDFYWPTLAHLGEQAILNSEIYFQADPEDEDVFGYQERYAEYRYKSSLITGKFRSTDAQTLDSWHLSQEFDALPLLNSSFIQENPPVDRVIAVSDEPHFIFDSYTNMRCARPMPLYGVPGLIDHF